MERHPCPLTADEKKSMIAQEAYSRYEKRGAIGGDSVEDWLAAEAEIEKQLEDHCQSRPRVRNLAAYPSLGRVTRKVRDLGESVPGIFERVSTMARQEMEATGAKWGHRWEDFRVKQTEHFKVWSGKGVYFMRHTSENFKDWMNRQRGKAK